MQLDLSDALNWPEYTKLFAGLLALLAIPNAIPVFIALTREHTPAEKRRIALVTALTVAITLVSFAWLGSVILDLFGISIASFRVAGGILILMSALAMMNPKPKADDVPQSSESKIAVGIVPLGIPLLAGPGSISTIIVYANLHESLGHVILVTLVILSITLIAYLAFRLAPMIAALLGQVGMDVFGRIMGLILGAIAIEFIFSGAAVYFASVLS